MVIKRIFSNFAPIFNVRKTNIKLKVRLVYSILLLLMLACLGCEWHLRPNDEHASTDEVLIDRYDRLERLYLTSGDIAALQQMNTHYPTETRMLIEDVLHLGAANDPEIKAKFLLFFQDSTLQLLVKDVEEEFADLSDVEKQLAEAFVQLKQMLPETETPHIYTQISSLDQSIVAGEGFLGISLDKYLGSDYPLYLKYGYTSHQRSMMTRQAIVPDCIGFYLLSLYPLPESDTTQVARHRHMGKIQYVVNRALGHRQFTNQYVQEAERQMEAGKPTTIEQFLQSDGY